MKTFPLYLLAALTLSLTLSAGCEPTKPAAQKPSLDSPDPKERLRAIKAAANEAARDARGGNQQPGAKP
jgi:hypothetical protein